MPVRPRHGIILVSFDVHPYSLDILRKLLVASSTNAKLEVPKIQIDYLDRYLLELKVKTVIIEDSYIDRDYLEDYVGFYSRSFHSYPRQCNPPKHLVHSIEAKLQIA